MACTVKVLTTIDLYEPEDFKDENSRRDAVANLKEALEGELLGEYSGEISYFKECFPDLGMDSQGLILGCERPDELLAAVTAQENLKISKLKCADMAMILCLSLSAIIAR